MLRNDVDHLATLRAEYRDQTKRVSWPITAATRSRSKTEGAHLLAREGRAAGRPSARAARRSLEARSYGAVRSPEVAEITGAGREWTVSMISALSIPWR
jgi:hypothetical protein